MNMTKSVLLTIAFALAMLAAPAAGLADHGSPAQAPAHIAKASADVHALHTAIASDLLKIQSDLRAGHTGTAALQGHWQQLHLDWNSGLNMVQGDWHQLHADLTAANGHGAATQLAHAMQSTQAGWHADLAHALAAAHQVAQALHTSLTFQGHQVSANGH
jgi:hypothetical protein